LEISPQKQKEQRQKQLDVSFFWCLFPSCTFWILCNLLLLFTFCQVCLPVKETAEIETGMTEKSSWDQANIRQKLGLVWRNRKKISQIIKDYFYLPFFLLIILWFEFLNMKNSSALKNLKISKKAIPPPCYWDSFLFYDFLLKMIPYVRFNIITEHTVGENVSIWWPHWSVEHLETENISCVGNSW
jgi:hypothetical protein